MRPGWSPGKGAWEGLTHCVSRQNIGKGCMTLGVLLGLSLQSSIGSFIFSAVLQNLPVLTTRKGSPCKLLVFSVL